MWRASCKKLLYGLSIAAVAACANAQQPSANSPGIAGTPENSDQAGSPKGKHQYGIFGFGSLIVDPGEELAAATERREQVETPFAIEYARSSGTRGGAPTLVPVSSGGAKVKAIVFVLKDGISQQEAENILWRRETRQVGSGKQYKSSRNPGPNTVIAAYSKNLIGLDKVFYTDFADSGKLTNPTASQLAKLAVESARNPELKEGMDGITYLMNAEKSGIQTPLTPAYEKEILRLTGTSTLPESLAKCRPAASGK